MESFYHPGPTQSFDRYTVVRALALGSVRKSSAGILRISALIRTMMSRLTKMGLDSSLVQSLADLKNPVVCADRGPMCGQINGSAVHFNSQKTAIDERYACCQGSLSAQIIQHAYNLPGIGRRVHPLRFSIDPVLPGPLQAKQSRLSSKDSNA